MDLGIKRVDEHIGLALKATGQLRLEHLSRPFGERLRALALAHEAARRIAIAPDTAASGPLRGCTGT